jgi:fibronectin-binding autotransporter adhesin
MKNKTDAIIAFCLCAGFCLQAFSAVTFTGDTSNGTETHIGASANGSLTIDGGSFFSSNKSVNIGRWNTGNGTANLVEGTWLNTGLIYVGANGTGVLNQSGGNLTVESWFVVGRWSVGKGDYNFTAGSFNHTNPATTIIVGENGRGTLDISGNSSLETASGIYVGKWSSPAGNGTVNLNGGTVKTGYLLGGDGNAALNFNGGKIQAKGNSSSFIGNFDSAAILGGGAAIDDGGYAITVAQAFSGSGPLTKNGTGTLTLSGNNSYTGATAINSGTLAVSHPGALGSTSAATVAQDAQLRISGNISIARPVFLNGGSGTDGLGDIYSIGNNTIAGHIQAGGSLTSEITANNNGRVSITGGISGTQEIMFSAPAGATIEVSGNGISTTGPQGVEARGAGLVLLNAPNTFTGTIQADGGTVEIGPSGSLQSGNASNALQVRNGNFTYSGTGNQILSGAISDLGGGPGRIIQNSAATLTLTGNSTYNGGLAIHSGTLEIGGAGRLGSGNFAGGISNNGPLLHSSSADQTLSGSISGSGSLSKTGAGTLVLSGNNTFSGATTVDAGTLRVNGSTASAVVVDSGATLGGSGSIGAAATLNAGANLAPGNSVGTLTFSGGLALGANSTVTMEIAGHSAFDRIHVTGGRLDYGGNLTVSFTGGYTPEVFSTYQLFMRSGEATFGNGFASLGFTNPGYEGTFLPESGVLTITAVPEPAALWLLALGASFLLWRAGGRVRGT